MCLFLLFAVLSKVGLMRETSEIPETIIIDHVVEATTLEEVRPRPLIGRGRPEKLERNGKQR